MSFYTYFFEIKNRSSLLALTWITSILVSYLYKEFLLFVIIKPILLYNGKEFVYFIFTDVTEVFSVFVLIVSFLSNQVTFFFFIYHLILFFLPGLYQTEYYKIRSILQIVFFVYFILIFFFNDIVLPYCWNFFVSFQNFLFIESITLYFEAKINEYLKFYFEFYFIFVSYFSILIVLIFFLVNIQKNLQLLKKFRKSILFCFIMMSTLLTPPDVVSQIFLGIFLIFSYELIFFSILFKKYINMVAS
jgi:sec-independent protein translocase protein TatC